MSTQSFINAVAPVAVDLRLDGSPIFASLRIAQAAHETGFRLHSWNNLVGFKVGSGRTNAYWKGAYVNKGTWEVYDGQRMDVYAKFRAYESLEDCFRDQDILFTLFRYGPVCLAKSPEDQARALQACGYATDPLYAQKLINIIEHYGLRKYDQEVDKMRELIESMNKRLQVAEKEMQELKQQNSMQIPDWAKEAVDAAVNAGIVDTPQDGSLDFYRSVTMMYRAGMFNGLKAPK